MHGTGPPSTPTSSGQRTAASRGPRWRIARGSWAACAPGYNTSHQREHVAAVVRPIGGSYNPTGSLRSVWLARRSEAAPSTAPWVPGPDGLWVANSSGIVITARDTCVIAFYTAHDASLSRGRAILDHACAAVAARLR
jgi:hypothetical protein